jgi:ABC-type nitrate/sulfonate/bicarbonate transport system substrate-binding protein
MKTTVPGSAALLSGFALCAVLAWRPALAYDYFASSKPGPATAALDVGIQPLGYPAGVISSVMARDRLLRSALAAAGHPLDLHPFRRGADMLALLGSGHLEAGLLGDMPAILAASVGNIWVVGLVKQSSTAVVASGAPQVHGLAGKRIGYVPASSAHYTLLQGLASAGLGERDVALVPLAADEMAAALARRDIDAFAAWEPAPSLALSGNARNRVVFRGLSTDYFVIGRAFERRAPEAARLLVAGFVRAIEWMRRSQKNAESAARWALADGAAFSGRAPALSAARIAEITRRDLLDVPSAPVIAFEPGGPTLLKNEFEFLHRLRKLPPDGSWNQVAAAFSYDGLARVLSEPRKFETRVFDYDQ